MSSWNQPLTIWQKVQEAWNSLIVIKTFLSVSVTAAFRGKNGAKQYNVHVLNAVTRKLCVTFTPRQLQCVLVLPTTGHCLLTVILGSGIFPPRKHTDSSWPAEASSRRLCLLITAPKATGLATKTPKMSSSITTVSDWRLLFSLLNPQLFSNCTHTNPAT